jgi:hypothetical protein
VWELRKKEREREREDRHKRNTKGKKDIKKYRKKERLTCIQTDRQKERKYVKV